MKKYWISIIEVDTDKELPNGFDCPPRMGAINAIEKAGFKVTECWSGWGNSENNANELLKIWISMPTEKEIK